MVAFGARSTQVAKLSQRPPPRAPPRGEAGNVNVGGALSILRAMGRFLRLVFWSGLALLVACLATQKGGPVQTPSSMPTWSERPKPRAPSSRLYTAEQALTDALSSPLQYVGTGQWPGVQRMYACAFRNERVLVVNAYCSITETNAVRIDVYSPDKGRVRLYAEGKGRISELKRPDYFTFTAETEPAPQAGSGLPAVHLGMSFTELRSYDARRYEAYLPACYGGTELDRKREGCLGPLEPLKAEWSTHNSDFLEHANDAWYSLVHQLRNKAVQHGKEPTGFSDEDF